MLHSTHNIYFNFTYLKEQRNVITPSPTHQTYSLAISILVMLVLEKVHIL